MKEKRFEMLLSYYEVEEAKKIAEAIENLIDKMKIGKCSFSFLKSDNTERKAIGTLSNDFIPNEKLPKNKGTNDNQSTNTLIVKYFDIEKQEWRCFDCRRFILEE